MTTRLRMRRASISIIGLAATLSIAVAASAGPAKAQSYTSDEFPTLPAPSERGDVGGGTPYIIGERTRKCKRPSRRKKVCRYYLSGRVYKTCVIQRKGGKRRKKCRRKQARPVQGYRPLSADRGPGASAAGLRSPRGAGKDAQAATLNNQFYPDPALAAVGRLFPKQCTATMVTRTIAVTAAHCLWDETGYVRDVSIYPGATWNGQATAPYGQWVASNWWVPQGYANGDAGLDYGLVQFLQTTNDGRYLGDVVGMWSIHVNMRFTQGERIQGVGYPAEGLWAQASYGSGWGQFACDSTWDGDYDQFSNLSASNTYFVYADCTMNGGSSGGPWFRQLSNGAWTIGAIEARGGCYPDKTVNGRCVPYARFAIAPYLDDRFLQFWNSVVG